MKLTVSRLWSEQDGFIVSAELLLIATILVIGLVAGLSAVRDAVVTELADVAQAIANLNQSYTVGAAVGHCGFNGGSSFIDLPDFCDQGVGAGNIQQSKCVVVCTIQNVAGGNPFAGQDGN